MPKRTITRLLLCCLFSTPVFGQEKHKDATDRNASSPSGSARNKSHHKKPIKEQYGIASFYSNKFEGRKTYTDEIFSQKKLSAASNTLPMRTWVRVTNLRNHRSVVLRINDKMHPRNHRLIDLSRAAARELGYTGRGLTRVKVEVLGRKRPPEAEPAIATKKD